MKTKEENEIFKKIGEKTVELLKLAYPNASISVEYNCEWEQFVFIFNGEQKIVNVNWDSPKTGIRDLATQLLCYDLDL